MKRIHIFGASGSGVTTLGQALSKEIGIPYFDSDSYFWEKTNPPFTHKKPPELRNNQIKNDLLAFQNWIFGGSSLSWGNDVFPDFSLVVFLRVPKETRLRRIEAREMERYGDLIRTDPQQARKTQEFLEWCADYDDCTGLANRNIIVHEQWLQSLPFPILKIEGNHSVEERIDLILDWIKKN